MNEKFKHLTMNNRNHFLSYRLPFLCLLLLASAGCASNRSILARIVDPNNVIGTIAQGIGGWRSVLGPTGEAVNVYPMHGGSVQSPMKNVSRLQRAGDGFLLIRIDDKIAPIDSPIDYVEIEPGTRRIILAPGKDAMFSYEIADKSFFLNLEIKPKAWYIFRTSAVEKAIQ